MLAFFLGESVGVPPPFLLLSLLPAVALVGG